MHGSTTRTTLALLVAAVVLPVAASARPDDREQDVATGVPSSTYVVGGITYREGKPLYPPALRPDNRAGVRGADVPLDPAIAAALEKGSTSTLDPAYLRALRIRGEALNQQYGEDPYLRALRLRGEALNEQFGTDAPVRPDDRAGVRAVDTVPVAVTSSDSFDWSDAGIGAIGAFGLALLAAGGMLLTLHVQHQRRDKLAAL